MLQRALGCVQGNSKALASQVGGRVLLASLQALAVSQNELAG
jgi:hypothetical protein